jgi:uncharacterized protein YceH (UPF0502 family)
VDALDEHQARVIGSLVEKQRTVPDTYPLTLNALVAACNQTSNRDPVVTWGEHEVRAALDSLKERGLLRFVHPSHGRSVTRYRQVVAEAEGLDDAELAVLAVLLLRGAQTVAELRTRTERYTRMAEAGSVDGVLDRLAGRRLVERLERRPGEREPRWRDLLTPWRADPAAAPPAPPAPSYDAVTRDDPGLEGRVAALEAEIAELRSVVDRLRDLL